MEHHTSDHIIWHDAAITAEQRAHVKQQRPAVLWYTGLSGSGKSTIANAVDALLHQQGQHTYVLDGDNIRHGLNQDLGFDAKSRHENIRRIAHVAKLFTDAGLIVSTAFISPFRADRQQASTIIGADFIEIWVNAALDVCESRDPKGLYQKARAGEIQAFTGIDSPYEPPESAQIILKNDATASIDTMAQQVVAYLHTNGYIGSTNNY